jgi:type VI secretion system secreted protein Hcp
MADSKFLLIMTGTKQGKIKGSNTKREGDLDFSKGVECHGFSYSVIAPRDAQSGPLTGRRSHKPLTITREVDSASPKLLQALCTNETFKSVTLQFSKTGSSGKPLPFRTIELVNGVIVDIRQAQGNTGKRRELVTLAYDDLLVNNIPHSAIPHFS